MPLTTGLPPDLVHLFFLPQGRFAFVARVVDDAAPPTAAPLWRVLANGRDPAALVPGVTPAGPAVWTSTLPASSTRLAKQMQRGGIALAGDAAHVHSPRRGAGA